MVVIGLAGAVASGKSLVAEHLRRLGAETLDADAIGHEVLLEPDVQEAVRGRWGESVFAEPGRIDRGALAAVVFAPPPSGPEELAHLERITHPKIEQRLRLGIAALARRGGVKAVVLDAAVLFKAGWDAYCDKIVLVEAPRRQRQVRARRRGWTEADFAAREGAQESLDLERGRADLVIDNSGSPDCTFEQVRRFWLALDQSPPTRPAAGALPE
jgi:dephospho-CoA kinase